MNDNKDDNLSVDPLMKSQQKHNELSISKQKLSNGCECTKIINNNVSSEKRKLILHFDNRNTLQVSLYSIYFHLSNFECIRLPITYQQQRLNKVCDKII